MNIHETGNATVCGSDSPTLFHVVWLCNACYIWKEIPLQYVACREKKERQTNKKKQRYLQLLEACCFITSH